MNRNRRSIRLRGCDYSQAGVYFVTICTHNRRGEKSFAPYESGKDKTMKSYSEQAFETAIKHHLTTADGYEKGDRDEFDTECGLFISDVIAFVRKTQPREW
ncbi:hypothetical protein M1N63_01560 [Thermodesulfovibrionales bacterium]|nr:hypothetical protein [Thermodesulfovibrionales bacterium]